MFILHPCYLDPDDAPINVKPAGRGVTPIFYHRILISMIRRNFLQSLKNSAEGVQSHLKFSNVLALFKFSTWGNFASLGTLKSLFKKTLKLIVLWLTEPTLIEWYPQNLKYVADVCKNGRYLISAKSICMRDLCVLREKTCSVSCTV